MKRTLGLFLVVVMLIFAGCGGKTVQTPFSSEERIATPYEKAVSDLRKAGFTSVNTEPVNTKHSDNVGNVVNIMIDGRTSFKRAESFSESAPVVVRYYRLIDKENNGVSFFK